MNIMLIGLLLIGLSLFALAKYGDALDAKHKTK